MPVDLASLASAILLDESHRTDICLHCGSADLMVWSSRLHAVLGTPALHPLRCVNVLTAANNVVFWSSLRTLMTTRVVQAAGANPTLLSLDNMRDNVGAKKKVGVPVAALACMVVF